MKIEETGTSFIDDEKQELAIVKQESSLQIQQLSFDDLDELEDYEPAPVELSSDYWSPEFAGETKKVIYMGIANRLAPSAQNKSELVNLPCVLLLTKEDGIAKQYCNASKRLVGIIQSFNLQPGAALQITYTGKQKNKTNSFSSDGWAVSPLLPKS